MFLMNIGFNIFYEVKRHNHILHWDRPLDGGRNFFDKNRILGESTTVGGLLLAIAGGLFLNWLFPGSEAFLKVTIVYFGHAIGSFIKRRFNKKRGEYVPILNHGDYIILAGVIFIFMRKISVGVALFSIILILIISPLMTYCSYKLGLRDNKF
jgi:CDP-2,3-bis-(O-geranylgeranyl)-sn-glycerol synthase